MSQPTIHICRPEVLCRSLIRFDCPDCRDGYKYGRRIVPPRSSRPFAVTRFEEWYGTSGTCLACGLQFDDQWISPRDFSPKWRERNIEHAKAAWRKWRGSR